jgi:hypothetical protein
MKSACGARRNGGLHFEGRIGADTATMAAMGQARGPISLTLSDGTVIDVVASEGRVGHGWEAIRVPLSASNVVPAAWPTKIVRSE